MGSKYASGGVGALADTNRVVVVGENSRNVDLMTDALAGYEVTAATAPEELNPVLSGSLPAGAVVVDTETVTEDVTALVEGVLDRDLPVVLLSQDAPAAVRQDAAATEGVEFREKPVRSADLRSAVRDAVN
jgi:DNA-binding NtrC family response regulator